MTNDQPSSGEAPGEARAVAAGRVRDFVDFYRGRIPRLWRGFVTFVPFLHDPDIERRELRFDPRVDLPTDEATGAWLVKLPDLCVICGEPAGGAWIDEPRRAWDLTRLVAWLASGFALGLVLLVTVHPIVAGLALVAGLVLGYVRRRSRLVRIRLRRCTQHAAVVEDPEAYIILGRLVVRTGAWRVKRQWLVDRGELPPEGSRRDGRPGREDRADPDEPYYSPPARSSTATDLSAIDLDDGPPNGPNVTR